MIESVEIKNFRCFRELRLGGLRRINLLVGGNATGKTALLESLFLVASGSPKIILRMRHFRLLGREVEVRRDRQSYESLWKDLLHSFDQKQTISITLGGLPDGSRRLDVLYSGEVPSLLPFGESAGEAAPVVPISFTWRWGQNQTVTVRPEFTDQGLEFGRQAEILPAVFKNPVVREGPSEDAKRFSELSKQRKSSAIVEALRKEFDFLEDLSIEFSAGAPLLHVSMRSLEDKIPLSLVSDGISKLVSMLVAAATFSKGLLLVDELENGLYYKCLAAVWPALLRFCRQYDTQLFASTHSMECLRAALPAIAAHDAEFCLIRTERVDGECSARVFAGADLRSAIEQEVEFR
jgi:hypothetical protein